MASITVSMNAEFAAPMRPLNILHDLPQVADLIELCFEPMIDDEGQSYVQQMRRASKDRAFLSWAGRVMDSASMPLAGYVWEDGGKVVGNVSLVYQVHNGHKLAMIANVATHPNFRRRGIGRALTERALLAARQKHASDIWLQVRDDNASVIRMYADLGFVERARRTTYRSRSSVLATPPATDDKRTAGPSSRPRGILISRPQARHWPRQRAWLQEAHPDELSWYSHWDWGRLGPGIGNTLHRLFVDYDMRQWAATSGSELLACASWIPGQRMPNALWLAGAPAGGEAVTRVLEAARRDLATYRRLTVEYPAGEFGEAIEAAGFERFRTLIWMHATGAEQSRIDTKKET